MRPKHELMYMKSDKKVDTASLLVDVDDGSETTVTADMKVQIRSDKIGALIDI